MEPQSGASFTSGWLWREAAGHRKGGIVITGSAGSSVSTGGFETLEEEVRRPCGDFGCPVGLNGGFGAEPETGGFFTDTQLVGGRDVVGFGRSGSRGLPFSPHSREGQCGGRAPEQTKHLVEGEAAWRSWAASSSNWNASGTRQGLLPAAGTYDWSELVGLGGNFNRKLWHLGLRDLRIWGAKSVMSKAKGKWSIILVGLGVSGGVSCVFVCLQWLALVSGLS